MTASIFDEYENDEVEVEEFDCEMDEGWDDEVELEYLLNDDGFESDFFERDADGEIARERFYDAQACRREWSVPPQYR